MRKLGALLVTVATLALAAPAPAAAGGSEDAALALGAFAVFNQLVRGDTVLHDVFGGRPREVVVRERVIVQQPPPVVYAPPPPVVYAPPPPVVYAPPPTVIHTHRTIIHAPPRVVYAPAPVYYRVPPGHFKHGKHHWKKRWDRDH